MKDRNADFGKEKRRQYILRTMAEFVGLGFLYLVWLRLTHLGIPCPFRLVTGYQCPGCGLTHCILALLRGDLVAAYRANGFLLILSPVAFVYFIYRTWRFIEHGRTEYSLPECIAFAILLLTAIGFGILRNV